MALAVGWTKFHTLQRAFQKRFLGAFAVADQHARGCCARSAARPLELAASRGDEGLRGGDDGAMVEMLREDLVP